MGCSAGGVASEGVSDQARRLCAEGREKVDCCRMRVIDQCGGLLKVEHRGVSSRRWGKRDHHCILRHRGQSCTELISKLKVRRQGDHFGEVVGGDGWDSNGTVQKHQGADGAHDFRLGHGEVGQQTTIDHRLVMDLDGWE